MNILQKIFTDHYEEMLYILHPVRLSLTTWTRRSTVGIPHLVEQCTPVPNAAVSSLSLFAVKAGSVLPVV